MLKSLWFGPEDQNVFLKPLNSLCTLLCNGLPFVMDYCSRRPPQEAALRQTPFTELGEYGQDITVADIIS